MMKAVEKEVGGVGEKLQKVLLSSHFKVCELERHPKATLNFLVDDYSKKLWGDSNKKKVSRNFEKRVFNQVLTRLRAMYGPYVVLRIRNLKKWEWDTNLTQVYKTDQGRLYGTNRFEDLFVTSHCLERWEERSKQAHYKHFKAAHKGRYQVEPTALDILLYLIERTFQVGIEYEQPFIRYLNINGGILVLEILDAIMIAKTFLTYEMASKKAIWYDCEPSESVLINMSSVIDPPSEMEDDELIKVDLEIPAGACYEFFKRF